VTPRDSKVAGAGEVGGNRMSVEQPLGLTSSLERPDLKANRKEVIVILSESRSSCSRGIGDALTTLQELSSASESTSSESVSRTMGCDSSLLSWPPSL
jgi:hypothetical protein